MRELVHLRQVPGQVTAYLISEYKSEEFAGEPAVVEKGLDIAGSLAAEMNPAG